MGIAYNDRMWEGELWSLGFTLKRHVMLGAPVVRITSWYKEILSLLFDTVGGCGRRKSSISTIPIYNEIMHCGARMFSVHLMSIGIALSDSAGLVVRQAPRQFRGVMNDGHKVCLPCLCVYLIAAAVVCLLFRCAHVSRIWGATDWHSKI